MTATWWFRLVPRKESPSSIQIYQDDEALNIDLEFEDKSMLEMIFRAGFRATLKLSDYKEGNYILWSTIRPRRPKA